MKNVRESFRFENGYYSYSKKFDGISGVAFAFDEIDAARMLGEEIPVDRLVSEYLKVSAVSDSSQRIHATISLARLGGELALSRIIELTEDHDDDVRSVAIDCLSSFPEEEKALDILIALLKEKDLTVRKASAVALGRLGNQEAVPALRSELSKNLSSRRLWKEGGKYHRNEVAEHVINLFRSLLKLGECSVLPEIVPLLLHKEHDIVESAADLFFKYKTQDDEIHGTVRRYIRKRRESGIINSIYDISANSKNWRFLRAALQSKNSCVRGQAAKHLGNIEWIEGRKTLIEYLDKGTDFEILLFIVESQRVRSVQVAHLKYILREALTHQWPAVRLRAARHLHLLPPAEGRKLAEEALSDEPDPLIKKALQAFIDRADCAAGTSTAHQDCSTGRSTVQRDYNAIMSAGHTDRTTDIPLIRFDSRFLQVDAQEKGPLKYRCSFCGMNQNQAERLIMKHRESKLIADLNVGICNNCIANLNGIVERSSLIQPAAEEKFQGKCSFCDRQIYYRGSLLTGPEVKICVECLDLCNKILKDD